VRGVFEKLVEEQEEVEWTRQAVAMNRRWQKIAALAAALATCCLVAIIALAVWRFIR